MRLVDADSLLDKLPDDLPYKAAVKRVLSQALTVDTVSVIECRDCKHYGWDNNNGFFVCKNPKGMRYADFYDYCSCAEKSQECLFPWPKD